MGLLYTATFDATITAAGGNTDLWSLDPAADKPVEICGMEFVVTSEIQEAQEEFLRIKVIRFHGGTFTVGTGGSAITPRPQNELNTVAFAGSLRHNDTGIATYSGGTTAELQDFGFNVRGGYGPVFFPPGYRHKVMGVAQSALVMTLQNTLADDITLVSTLWLEEG